MVTSTVIKTRFRAVLSFLLILLMTTAFGQGGKQPPPPPSPGRGGTVGGFEVDADFRPNLLPDFWFTLTQFDPDYIPPAYYPNTSTLGADWRSVLSYNATTHTFSPIPADNKRATGKADGNWGNQSQVPEVVSFAGTSNKNGDQIGLGQSPYLLQDGGTGPQKNDITNTFLHSREASGNGNHTWLFFAAETRATNGASYLDFEYNQKGVYVDPATKRLIGKGKYGGRTPGDFILIVDYVGGGQTPVVSVRVWDTLTTTTGQWSDTLPASQIGAFITANVLNVPALDSANKSSYADNGAPSSFVKALQMVEGGIDITNLKDIFPQFANLNLCSPDATVTVKTRSSPSFTSELKDLDVLPFSIIPGPPGTNTSQTVCPDTVGGTYGTFDLRSVSNVVVGAGGHVVSWFKDVAFAQLITDSSSYTAPNGTVVYAQLTNADGCISTAADTLKVRTSPAAPSSTYNAPACDSSTFTVTVSGVVQGVTYQIRDKNGNLISGLKVNYTTAATTGSYLAPNNSSFKFTNIPAGSGYRLRAVDANSCPSIADSCGAPSSTPAWVTKVAKPTNEDAKVIDVLAQIKGNTKVLAAPNPFTDRIRFTMQSDISGQGSLEVFNLVGQKIQTIYQGYVEAGKILTKEYVVPKAQRANLIYIFRVGDQKATGKLINR